MQKREFLLLSFFLVSLLIYFFSASIISPFEWFGSITSPIRANMYALAHAQSQDSSYAKLEQENKRLKEQLIEMENLKKENNALRSQFQETFISSSRLLPAKVIGYSGQITNPNALFIGQGEKSGVKEGAAVIVGKELVGKVGKVSSWGAEVILASSRSFTTLAYTGKTNATGVITGQNDFLLFDHVVITDTLNDGDVVLTKGEVFENGAIIPEGLLIGQIIDVSKAETRPFQSAVVKSPIIATKLLTVFVVTQ